MNKIDQWMLAIKRGESGPARIAKQMAKALLRIEMPDVAGARGVYSTLSRAMDAADESREWAGAKLLWTPMLRARCAKAGPGLYLTTPPRIRSHAKIELGDNCVFSSFNLRSGRFCDEPEFTVGDNADVGFQTLFVVNKRVTIGHHVQIAPRVVIQDSDGHPTDLERRMNNAPLEGDEIAPVTIGDHVWIGRDAHIMKGVTIGRGAVIGAGSVVVTDVPEGCVAMGVPARVLKR